MADPLAYTGSYPVALFLSIAVNHSIQGHVVGTSQDNSPMTMNTICTLWPEDERDRKRAPAHH